MYWPIESYWLINLFVFQTWNFVLQCENSCNINMHHARMGRLQYEILTTASGLFRPLLSSYVCRFRRKMLGPIESGLSIWRAT